MTIPSRLVMPETLDALDPDDPLATRSRQDLRRVHRAMRTVSILNAALRRLPLPAPPRQILELGGGDGSLTLRLARAIRPRWPDVTLTILDRHDIVSRQTLRGYQSLGWQLQVVSKDACEWASGPTSKRYDLCMTSLFLHHFDDAGLLSLMRAIADRCGALVACEPRRSTVAALGSAWIGLLGTNQVTQEDAVTSVAAGFTRQELSALWPNGDGRWICREYSALPFSHCFTARLRRFGAAPVTS